LKQYDSRTNEFVVSSSIKAGLSHYSSAPSSEAKTDLSSLTNFKPLTTGLPNIPNKPSMMSMPRNLLGRAANNLRASTSTAGVAVQSRALSTSRRRASAHEGDHYDPPTGWLWGVKPGEKPEKEGWENVFIYGMFGSLGLAAVAYAFKPDTS
jgi:hypothetical protein